jgi:tetratricopeptide (TPR) repeat protein
MKKKWIGLTLSLCLVLALSLAAADKPAKQELAKPQSKEALKKMEKAEKAIQANDLNAALVLYNEVIALEPNYAPVYFTSAQVNRNMGGYDLALTNYEKALAINPDFPQAQTEYIRTLLALSQKAVEGRDQKKAIAYYEKIMTVKNIEATYPKELQHAAFQAGSLAYGLQDFNKSVEYFLRFLAIPDVVTTSPNNSALAWYMLGINFSRLNQADKAISYLEKFIAGPQNETTTPWMPISHYLLANNHYQVLEGQIAKIKEEKNADVLATFDGIAAAAKAIPAIQPNLTKAIELKPDLEDAYLKLGNYYFYCQDFDNALKVYNDLIAKFPTSADIASYKSFQQNIVKERELINSLKTKKKKK